MIIIQSMTDAGPPGYNVDEFTLTRVDIGLADPHRLVGLNGLCEEHLLFQKNPYGRYTKDQWENFLSDLKKNGMAYPITIFKEKDGRSHIHEGNHRIRAAIQIGMSEVPVEIRYFGNSQKTGLVNI